MATSRSQRILQNFLLVWLDASMNEKEHFFKTSLEQLRQFVASVNTFTNPNECYDFMKTIQDETIFLIVSGSLGQYLVPRIHSFTHLKSIYILCNNKPTHQQWSQQFFKVRGVHTTMTSIYKLLKQDCEKCDRDKISISYSGIDSTFMYSQLIRNTLLETDDDDKMSVKELVDYLRLEKDISESEIQRVENEYNQHSPIWWYTAPFFVYQILNRGLRMFDIDILMKMGFFVRHLYNHIEKLFQEQMSTSANMTPFKVNRGQGLLKEDFDKLMKSRGNLLSFNNFLSTSTNRSVSLNTFARHFAVENPNDMGILFHMTIDPKYCDKSSVVFADVKDVGYFKGDEAEILFSTHSIFHINDIQKIQDPQLNNLWEVHLTLASNDVNYELRDVGEQIVQDCRKTGWPQFGFILTKLEKYAEAEQLFQILLKKASSDRDRAIFLNNLGLVYTHKPNYTKARSFYEQSLNISKNCQSNADVDQLIADTCHNIGNIYQHLGEYAKALSYQQRALSIRQKCLPSGHLRFAYSYIAIGIIYCDISNFSKALSYYDKALEIQKQKRLSPYHPDYILSYNSIGNVYLLDGDYPKALSYFERVLDIQQKSLIPNQKKFVTTYRSFAGVYCAMGQYSKALSYYQQALDTLQKHSTTQCSNLAFIYDGFGTVYYITNNYTKALSFFEQALTIMKETLPSSHPRIAKCYMHISNVYKALSNYPKAWSLLEYTLHIQQKTLSPNHLNIADTYKSMGVICYDMKNYDKALECYEKALAITKISLHSDHPNIAEIYTNIANAYKQKDDIMRAISYEKRSMKIYEKVYSPNHPKLANAYMNIGNTYYYLKDYTNALSFNQKSIHVAEKTDPPNYAVLASALENRGLIYEEMHEYTKSLSFLQRALDNQQKIFSSTHQLIQKTLKNIQRVKRKAVHPRQIYQQHYN